MITLDDFNRIKAALWDHPEPLNGQHVADHILWSESVGPPATPEDFALEAIYVICNSGMKHTIARTIYERCADALMRGEPVSSEPRGDRDLPPVFGHHGKTFAIDDIWDNRMSLFAEFLAAEDKVEFCGTLPWIGEITKFHLAKNFGADVAKPDVHLDRLARAHRTTPQALCDELAALTGYKSRTIDLILWMACAKGIINSAEEASKAAA